VFLGLTLGAQGKLASAIDEFHRALQIQRSNQPARDALARALRQKVSQTMLGG